MQSNRNTLLTRRPWAWSNTEFFRQTDYVSGNARSSVPAATVPAFIHMRRFHTKLRSLVDCRPRMLPVIAVQHQTTMANVSNNR